MREVYRFSGAASQVLDQKGRVTIPSRCRQDLGTKVVLVYGRTLCVEILPQQVFDRHLDYMTQLDEVKDAKEYDRMRRFLFSAFDAQEVDKQGRVLIPVKMREKLSLGTEIVVAGAGDHLEIWGEAAFTAFMEGA